MTTKQQDLLWSVLSKEERRRNRDGYKAEVKVLSYNSGFNDALDSIFGHHNLTSDTEPEDMLIVDKKTITDIYEANERIIDSPQWTESRKDIATHVNSLFETIFGDKCLPDKELEHRLEQSVQASVQVEPKLRVKLGDKVRVKGEDKVREVYRILPDGRIMFGDKGSTYSVEDLEPYTEENKETIVSKGDTKDDTKETMEEKELNLCELLKGCEGEEFWSPMFDAVRLSRIDLDDEKPLFFNWKDGVIYTRPNGVMYKNTRPIIFPSRALYEKYPLDPYSAWMEWKSERKPKRWRAKQNESHWFIEATGEVSKGKDNYYSDCDNCWMFGNYFRTEKEARQAAEAVRETLMKIQEQNQKQ